MFTTETHSDNLTLDSNAWQHKHTLTNRVGFAALQDEIEITRWWSKESTALWNEVMMAASCCKVIKPFWRHINPIDLLWIYLEVSVCESFHNEAKLSLGTSKLFLIVGHPSRITDIDPNSSGNVCVA